MISHQNLDKAAHCGWSEVEKNFVGVSKYGLPNSERSIDWSNSDEEYHENIEAHNLLMKKPNLSCTRNLQGKHDTAAGNNLSTINPDAFDINDFLIIDNPSSPIISSKSIKGRIVEQQLSPKFKSSRKAKKIEEYNSKRSKTMSDSLIKGSSWLKGIHHKTPEKSCKIKSDSHILQLDSAKKKLEKNGFASQFAKLMQYWKSDVIMFDHQINSNIRSDINASYKENLNSHSNDKSTTFALESYECPVKKVFKCQRHLQLEVIQTKMKTSFNSFFGKLLYDSKKDSESCRNDCNNVVYLVYCGIYDKKDIFPISVGSEIHVYSPWQELEMNSENIILIFSSYYKLNLMVPKFIITQTIQIDKNVLKEANTKENRRSKEFLTVVKSSEHLKKNEVITLGQVLSLSNEHLDTFISVIFRVIKVKKIRNHKSGSKEESGNFLIFGQDPSGAFMLIRLHSDSLDLSEWSKLKSYIGSTRTFGGLFNPKRITDSEMPSLFTLIKSLHRSYVNEVENSASLSILVSNRLKREQPTFIYVFHTSSKLIAETFIAEEVYYIKLPHWQNVVEAEKEPNGQRGSLLVDIVYYYESIIYVMPINIKVTGLLRIYVTKNCPLPDWMSYCGTLSISATMEDVLVNEGNIIADQYSVIAKFGEDFEMTFYQLLEILPTYDLSHPVNDICIIKGEIRGVNEETASIWVECRSCRSTEFASTSDIFCNECYFEQAPTVKYYLEVFLKCETDFEDETICVKLYQKTIDKLFKSSFGNIQMLSTKLTGVDVGPLVVAVDEVRCNSVLLIELPY